MGLTQYSDPFTLSSLTGSAGAATGKDASITLSSDCIADLNNNDVLVICMLDYTYEAINGNPITSAPHNLSTSTPQLTSEYKFLVAMGGDGDAQFGSDGTSQLRPKIEYTRLGVGGFVSSSHSAMLELQNNSTPGTPVWADIRRKTVCGIYNDDGNTIRLIGTGSDGRAYVASGASGSSDLFQNITQLSKDESAFNHVLTRMYISFDISGVNNVSDASLVLRTKTGSEVSGNPTANGGGGVVNIDSGSHSLILAKVDPVAALPSGGVHAGFTGSLKVLSSSAGLTLEVNSGELWGTIPGTGSADTTWIFTPTLIVPPPDAAVVAGARGGGFGVGGDFTINTYSSAVLGAQHAKTGDQVPFSLGTPGARYLRGRPTAYATEKGEKVTDKDGRGKKGKKKEE